MKIHTRISYINLKFRKIHMNYKILVRQAKKPPPYVRTVSSSNMNYNLYKRKFPKKRILKTFCVTLETPNLSILRKTHKLRK